jgi:hypothetical protein
MRDRFGLWLSLLSIGAFHLPAESNPPRNIRYQYTHTLTTHTPSEQIQIILTLPVSEPGKQVVHDIRYDPQPDRLLNIDGRQYARFVFKDPGTDPEISVRIDATLYPQNQESQRIQAEKPLTEAEKRQWIQSQPKQETNLGIVRNMADNIPAGLHTEGTVDNILDAVKTHMTFDGFKNDDQGVLNAIKTGKGDCNEYTDLFVTLCRAKGIPARARLCIIPDSIDTPLHAIAEVYIDNKGWVTYDPLLFDQKPRLNDTLPNRYLYYSILRNDPNMQNFFSDKVYIFKGEDPKESFQTHLEIFEQRDGELKLIKQENY